MNKTKQHNVDKYIHNNNLFTKNTTSSSRTYVIIDVLDHDVHACM